MAPYMPMSILYHNKATIPNVPLQKRKKVAPDGITTFKVIHIFAFVENLDMLECMKNHMVTKVHHPVYIQIQDFFAKVNLKNLFSLVLFIVSILSNDHIHITL